MTRGYLSLKAASDYLLLCCVSHKAGIIDDATCHQRLLTLSQITERESQTNRLVRLILKKLDLNCEVEQWDENSDSSTSNSNSATEEENNGEIRHPKHPNLLYFRIMLNRTNWDFHPGDADFFPSVPHGHDSKGSKARKLDAYQGHIHEKKGKKFIKNGRLPRTDIITLWNDDKFREIAKEALLSFMGLNPNFHWGGTTPGLLKNGLKPTDLPKKR